MGAEIAAMQFTASRFLSFRIPAKAIAALVPDVEDRAVRRIARDTEALKLLTVYAGGLQDAPIGAPALRQLAVTHVHDLVALALGTACDPAETAKGRGVRAARLAAIKADIEQELAQDLSLSALAARHRLPLRYVRRLFEEDGTTFTEFLLQRRLARAHRMLLSPRATHLKISVVATETGFNNLSYFNERSAAATARRRPMCARRRCRTDRRGPARRQPEEPDDHHPSQEPGTSRPSDHQPGRGTRRQSLCVRHSAGIPLATSPRRRGRCSIGSMKPSRWQTRRIPKS